MGKISCITPSEKGEYYRKMWDAIWSEQMGEYKKLIAAIKQMRASAINADDMDSITADMVRAAAALFTNSTGLGADLWEPIWLKNLSDEAAKALAELLNCIEHECMWPTHCLISIIVLMGRPPPRRGKAHSTDANAVQVVGQD